MDITEVKLPEGWFSDENVATYRKLANQIPDGGVLIELGCWYGRSICSIADIIRTKRLQVYLVDSFTGFDNEVGQYGDVTTTDPKQILIGNLVAFGIHDYVQVVPKSTDEATEDFKRAEPFIDLLFIDADHSYWAVRNDITNWGSKVKGSGYIAGHDFNRPGVRRALREMLWPVEHESTIWFNKRSATINFDVLDYDDQDAQLDLMLEVELGDHPGVEIPVSLLYLVRMLGRLKTLKERYPDALALADIPETKKYIMDFYNEQHHDTN